jgi:hypothetical protein
MSINAPVPGGLQSRTDRIVVGGPPRAAFGLGFLGNGHIALELRQDRPWLTTQSLRRVNPHEVMHGHDSSNRDAGK